MTQVMKIIVQKLLKKNYRKNHPMTLARMIQETSKKDKNEVKSVNQNTQNVEKLKNLQKLKM